MSTAWWVITSACAFGYLVTILPLLPGMGRLGILDASREPLTALFAQGLVLWLAGTSVMGTAVAFVTGLGAMRFSMWLRKRREAKRP